MTSLVTSLLAIGHGLTQLASLTLGQNLLPQQPIASTSVVPMAVAQEQAYTPAALFATAAYCPASQTRTWSCGANCDAIPGFIPYGSGGDGGETQYWFVGYDPTFFQAIVVGHQGTDPDNILSVLTDENLFLGSLNSTLFPGVPTGLQAHRGFLATHSRSAQGVLAAVWKAHKATGSRKVVLTGHSLGAAIALLDAIYLPLHTPPFMKYTTQVFGLPRVGNRAFADYVDTTVTNLAHITNQMDPIPTIPGRGLGYAHPSREKHIVSPNFDEGSWYDCAGQDNTNAYCSTGAVRNVLEGNLNDHIGPYNGVEMGCPPLVMPSTAD